MRPSLLAALLSLVLIVPAAAQVRMSGSFTATRSCPATQSIRGGEDPGGLAVEAGRSYPLTGANKAEASFYQIEIGGGRRWVAVGCGTVGAGGGTVGVAATHVLAMSWQPAFCAGHERARECAGRRYDPAALALHGLWPQPIGHVYCGVDAGLAAADERHRWDRLPAPAISPATRAALAAVLPGLESGLERHEWIKHGTCFGTSADAYFARAAALAQQVNASAVRALFVGHAGQVLTVAAVREAFDRSFGPGAGARVTLSCTGDGDRRVISEMVIGLAGDVAGSTALPQLIAAAAPAKAGCPGGLVVQP